MQAPWPRRALNTVLSRIVTNHRRQNPHGPGNTGDAPYSPWAPWIELAVGNLLSNAESTAKDQDIGIASPSERQHRRRLSWTAAMAYKPSVRKLWDLYEGRPVDAGRQWLRHRSGALKELMEDMGGQVWAGPRDGGGSVFALTLPAPWDAVVPEALSTPLSNASADEGAYSYPQAAWAA